MISRCGLVVVALALAQLALDDPELLELLDQARIGARLLDDVVERVHRALVAQRERQPAQRGSRPAVGRLDGTRRGGRGLRRLVERAPCRQLLTDHRERQELVALQPQDRPQARDVGGGVEPVAAGRAPRRQQLLVLQVADLRDRDVGELLLEPLADRADRQRLGLARRLLGGGGSPFALGSLGPVASSDTATSARQVGELVFADLQLVAVLELVRLDPAAVDVRAVQRPGVVQEPVVRSGARARRDRARRSRRRGRSRPPGSDRSSAARPRAGTTGRPCRRRSG